MDNATLTPEQHVAQLVEQLRQKDLELEAKDNIIATQDEQLVAANAQGASALSVITHGKKHYQVLAGRFSIDGKVITHTELKADPALVKVVVEKYPGLVQELAEKKA
ncbi:MAG: hypothetical protein ACRYF0_09520 [Janthinobacterium lividum]